MYVKRSGPTQPGNGVYTTEVLVNVGPGAGVTQPCRGGSMIRKVRVPRPEPNDVVESGIVAGPLALTVPAATGFAR